jgi:hypothetical protein
MLFLMRDSARDINASEQDKDKGLDDGREDGHGHKRERKNKRDDGGNDDDEQFLGEDIAEKPQGKRDRPGKMADNLNREKKRSQGRNRAGEMLEVLEDSLSSYSLPVIVNKNRDGTARCHVELACGRHKAWDEAEQVRREDKKADGPDHREIFSAFLADDVHKKILKRFDCELEDALQLRRDARKPSGRESEQQNEKHRHNKTHDNVIWDWTLRVLGMNAKEAEEGENGLPENSVKKFDDEETVF